jgi:uncharacterized protein (DUF58 family)
MLQRIFAIWDSTSFYLSKLVYYCGFGIAVIFALSYFATPFFNIALLLLICLLLSIGIDAFILYRKKDGMEAERFTGERMSNGDENKVVIELNNQYEFKALCLLIDELPFQFQERKWKRVVEIERGAIARMEYVLKPNERGEYHFGNINVYVKGPLQLVRRRFIFHNEATVKVCPSYIQMRRYGLMAVAHHLQQTGVKRMRKLGHSMEFEQIK